MCDVLLNLEHHRDDFPRLLNELKIDTISSKEMMMMMMMMMMTMAMMAMIAKNLPQCHGTMTINETHILDANP